VAVLEKLLNLLLADVFQGRRCGTGEKKKKRVQISVIGGDSVLGKPSLDGQMLQEKLQVLVVIDVLQRRMWLGGKQKPRRRAVGACSSDPASHPVELAKFTQGFGCFAAFFDAGFFVILTPFQLSFDTVDLQFFLQLPDRVFKVTSDIYFDHNCITSFGGWPGPLVRVWFQKIVKLSVLPLLVKSNKCLLPV
jgi:hypothetical protein